MDSTVPPKNQYALADMGELLLPITVIPVRTNNIKCDNASKHVFARLNFVLLFVNIYYQRAYFSVVSCAHMMLDALAGSILLNVSVQAKK